MASLSRAPGSGEPPESGEPGLGPRGWGGEPAGGDSMMGLRVRADCVQNSRPEVRVCSCSYESHHRIPRRSGPSEPRAGLPAP